MRTEIEHLHQLARMATDPRVIAELQLLIAELEDRVSHLEAGHA